MGVPRGASNRTPSFLCFPRFFQLSNSRTGVGALGVPDPALTCSRRLCVFFSLCPYDQAAPRLRYAGLLAAPAAIDGQKKRLPKCARCRLRRPRVAARAVCRETEKRRVHVKGCDESAL
eukprot:1822618-Prymnesium_polylepis.1